MAVVVRYFSTAAAGAGDGTTWANRAALFVSSNWSTVITGFNFTSDSLECRIGPGSYSSTESLMNTLFTNPPTNLNSLWLMACDTSGNRWEVPDLNWVSAQPMWSTTDMPVISATVSTNPFFGFSSGNTCNCYGLDISVSRAGGSDNVGTNYNWCRITNTANSVGAIAVNLGRAANCVIRCTGTTFSQVYNSNSIENCRLEGNASASSGSRRGTTFTTTVNTLVSRCTFLNCIGGGFQNTGNGRLTVLNSIFINCGTAIAHSGAGELGGVVANNIIIGNTTGISTATGNCQVSYNRLRNNTTNFSLGTHAKQFLNNTSAGTDADEFVDAAGGDYRIKKTSSLWGTNLGVGDEPASGGAGGLMLPYAFQDF